MAKGVFAGTFDPVTIGHESIINKCCEKYSKVFVVLGKNPKKSSFFSEEERLTLLKECFKSNPKVEVINFSQIENYSQYLQNEKVSVYVRGIRNDNDLKYEEEYKLKNQEIFPFITTEFIWCDKEFSDISSTTVKSQIINGNFINVPKSCRWLIEKILKQKQI